jgi:hypothetical protein
MTIKLKNNNQPATVQNKPAVYPMGLAYFSKRLAIHVRGMPANTATLLKPIYVAKGREWAAVWP